MSYYVWVLFAQFPPKNANYEFAEMWFAYTMPFEALTSYTACVPTKAKEDDKH